MWAAPENDQYGEALFLVGERVTAGLYRQLGTNRAVLIPETDYLPASLDCQVACYVRVALWADVVRQLGSEESPPEALGRASGPVDSLLVGDGAAANGRSH